MCLLLTLSYANFNGVVRKKIWFKIFFFSKAYLHSILLDYLFTMAASCMVVSWMTAF